MIVYAFYMKEQALSQKLKDYLFIDMDKDLVLENEIEQGVILYAWTEDKPVADLFQLLRSERFYKKKLEFENEQCSEFEAFKDNFGERELYQNKLASRNENPKTKKETIDIPMVMTSFESHHVDSYWEGLDDDLYEMFKVEEDGDKLYYSIYNILKPEYQEALDTLSYTEMLDEFMIWIEEGRFNNGIILDEFAIFMDVYSETFR